MKPSRGEKEIYQADTHLNPEKKIEGGEGGGGGGGGDGSGGLGGGELGGAGGGAACCGPAFSPQ